MPHQNIDLYTTDCKTSTQNQIDFNADGYWLFAKQIQVTEFPLGNIPQMINLFICGWGGGGEEI